LNDKLSVMLIMDCQGLVRILKTTLHSTSLRNFGNTPVKKSSQCIGLGASLFSALIDTFQI